MMLRFLRVQSDAPIVYPDRAAEFWLIIIPASVVTAAIFGTCVTVVTQILRRRWDVINLVFLFFAFLAWLLYFIALGAVSPE